MNSGKQAPFILIVVAILITMTACSGATPAPDPTETPTPGTIAATPALIPNTPGPEDTAPPAPEPTGRAKAAPTPAQQPAQSPGLWRGLVIAPENRCSPYDSDDYPYSQSVEAKIVNAQGGIYGPYTGNWFSSTGDTDIEHILARSEAHDSASVPPAGEPRPSSPPIS